MVDYDNIDKVRQNLINYLTDSFRPIVITTYNKVWQKLKYKNAIFGTSYYPDYDTKNPRIFWESSFIRNSILPNYEPHPLPYLADLLNHQIGLSQDINKMKGYNGTYTFPLEQIKEDDDNYINMKDKLSHIPDLDQLFPPPLPLAPLDPKFEEMLRIGKEANQSQNEEQAKPPNRDMEIWTLDTEGNYPFRWITMIADFAFPRVNGNKSLFHIDFKTSSKSIDDVRANWTKLINDLPENVIRSICIKIYNMMENNRFGVNIIKSPAYTMEDWEEYLEDKNNPSYFNDRYNRCDKNLEKLIEDRDWLAGNGFCYPGTLMFFHKVNNRNYRSFALEFKFEKYKKIGMVPKGHGIYGSLAACEGGITLYYNDFLPWVEYRSRMVMGGNNRGDIRYNPYRSRKDVSFEEIVILAETLRMEGAEFEIVK